MFIGEQGAATLDAAEETTARLDNLAMARAMEEADKDAKSVKLATGWERGKDGKWRYEIDDSTNGIDLGWLEEGRITVGYIVDAPELFGAYPQLKKIVVALERNLSEDAVAAYSKTHNTIFLNPEFRSNVLRPALYHEIQHSIQRIEGFARGGAEETFVVSDEGMVDVGRQLSDNQLATARQAWKSASPELQEKFRAMNRARLAKNFNELDELEATLSNDESKIWVEYSTAMGTAREYRKRGEWKTPGEAYEALAGEVEARNVQRRMGMTPEQRRASLASETEGIAREDQIVLQRIETSPEITRPKELTPEEHSSLSARLLEMGARRAARRPGWSDRGDDWKACPRPLRDALEALASIKEQHRKQVVVVMLKDDRKARELHDSICEQQIAMKSQGRC